ncbi:MAG: hypothetical protein HKN11_19160 [Rhizobiales bacterium]|nr:hypothetical protein [Hyphomicrobiales bacterium]
MNDNLVREQVEKMVSDPLFGPSNRISRFLRYIVEETLNGASDRLKAYSIALSVFDRDHSFDPQGNSIVRVQAKRLRMQLKLYYITTGRTDPVLIEIPKGSYVPKFSYRSISQINGVETSCRKTAFHPPASGIPVVAFYPCSRLYSAEWHKEFCSGLMEELVIAFSKFREIAIVPLATTLPELHTIRDPIGYGVMFGADFVLETSIRGNDDSARLSVKLNDTRSGLYAGTASYDISHDPDGMIPRQETIANELASLAATPFGLLHNDQRKLLKSGKKQPSTAYEHLLLADAYYLEPSQASFDRALAATTKATKMAPEYPIGNAMLAILHIDGYLAGYDGLAPDETMLDDGYQIAAEALQRFPDDCDTNLAVCMAQFARGRDAEACRRGRMAIELNPNNKLIQSDYWFYRATHGDWEEAICEMDKIARSSVADLNQARRIKAINAYRVGQFEKALDLFEQACTPHDFLANLHVVMCLGQLDRAQPACEKIRQLKSLRPDLSLNLVARLFSRNYQPALTRQCMEGLLLAGFDNSVGKTFPLPASDQQASRTQTSSGA